MNHSLWGIDLGGTKIEGIVLESIDNPSAIIRTRVDTGAAMGYEHIIGQIVKLVAGIGTKIRTEAQDRSASVLPAYWIRRLQTMKNCNTTALNGKPLQKDLEAKLKIPVILANDANCFGLAEALLGRLPWRRSPRRKDGIRHHPRHRRRGWHRDRRKDMEWASWYQWRMGS